ncbi:TPA: hypothetical protein KNJ64_001991 [Clostridioides difficile]|nr:hypothetical protein [Clostridioides difficile]EIS9626768.1 hypothetical protein [Clostridioides difficile]MBS5787193.1 hypothetical protein [Clostridioides difficile]MBY2485732.1 hypothetical protein [Clostridioides difficile]MCW0565049.1 hypothetical protein [Clostridioides difficile]
MNRNIRELRDIRNDLKLIMGNKLSISQSKSLFMGIFYEIILNKDLFSKNRELKEFINGHMLPYINRDKKYKDYLFKSRTLFAATILKDIYINVEYNQVIKMVEELYSILPDDIEKESRNHIKKNSSDEVLSGWLSLIMNKDK